jgi:hypothetical protein
MKLLPLGVLAFALGWIVPQPTTEIYRGEFMVVKHADYSSPGSKPDGIQFFALSRIGKIDMATCSIDANLPLAAALRLADGKRIRLTIDEATTELQELKR